jgi:hypothetical protein
MKRVIFLGLFAFGFAVGAAGQTGGSAGSGTTGGAGSTAAGAKKSSKARPSERLNNRRTYKFKNGQRSTPTGNEATPVGSGGYAALGRDDAGPKSDTVAGTAVKTTSMGPKPKKQGTRAKRKQ